MHYNKNESFNNGKTFVRNLLEGILKQIGDNKYKICKFLHVDK